MTTWTDRLLKKLKEDPNDYAWDDIQVSIATTLKGGSAPAQRSYNFGIGGGVDFLVNGFAIGEAVYINIQTSHAMNLNSVLDNHIHFILPDNTGIGDRFQFQLDVIGAGIGDDFTVAEGSPFTSERLIIDGDHKRHSLLELADIPPMNTTVSSIYECVLTRISATADDYAGEVYVIFNDGHYQKSSDGSYFEGGQLTEEYQKQKGTPSKPYKKGAW